MQLQAITCKKCAAPIAAEGISEALAVARCGYCDTIFSIRDASGGVAAVRPKLPLPKGLVLKDYGTSLEIRRRWFSPVVFGLLAFAVIWNGFLIVWHSIALASGAWFMSLFGLIHTGVGIGIGYFVLAMFLNTTTISVRTGELRVRSGPLPWPGSKSIDSSTIGQLYVKEKITHGKNGTSVTYELMALRNDQVSEKILAGVPQADQALYIEQEIERHLKLADRPVAGELPR